MLCTFGNLVALWYIFPRFGLLCQEKSGNPGVNAIASSVVRKDDFLRHENS
jgi:hypothetical protein